jgi:hypothetical protein
MPVSLAMIRIVPGRLEVGDGAAATAQTKEPR